MGYQVIARFFHRASGAYIDPGQDCPLLSAEDTARLVRARCLVEVLERAPAPLHAVPPPAPAATTPAAQPAPSAPLPTPKAPRRVAAPPKE